MKTFTTYINLVCDEFGITKDEYYEWCHDVEISITKCRKMFQKKNRLMMLSCLNKHVTRATDDDIYEYYCVAHYIVFGEIFDFPDD